MKNVCIWSRIRHFSPGGGAYLIWSEPESAPGPRTSGARAGAAQKSGGSATLVSGRILEMSARNSIIKMAGN